MTEEFRGFLISKSEIENWDLFEVCCSDQWCENIDPIDLGDKVIANCYHAKKGSYEEFAGIWDYSDGWCHEEYLDVKSCNGEEECERLREEWEKNNGCCMKVIRDKYNVTKRIKLFS